MSVFIFYVFVDNFCKQPRRLESWKQLYEKKMRIWKQWKKDTKCTLKKQGMWVACFWAYAFLPHKLLNRLSVCVPTSQLKAVAANCIFSQIVQLQSIKSERINKQCLGWAWGPVRIPLYPLVSVVQGNSLASAQPVFTVLLWAGEMQSCWESNWPAMLLFCLVQVIKTLDPKLNPASAEIMLLRKQILEKDKRIEALEVKIFHIFKNNF